MAAEAAFAILTPAIGAVAVPVLVPVLSRVG
jgi:hypothetical protein